LNERKILLQKAVTIVKNWVPQNAANVEWVRPHTGVSCCVRLKPAVFTAEVDVFYAHATNAQVQLASAECFGDKKSIIKLGFGFLSLPLLEQALSLLEDTFKTIKGS
jgi:DNA-binding transcriptional MocR family regulator